MNDKYGERHSLGTIEKKNIQTNGQIGLTINFVSLNLIKAPPRKSPTAAPMTFSFS